jgi:hypothetical protein
MSNQQSTRDEINERIALCIEQLAASPYGHTTAARWYAEDVPGLVEQLEAAYAQRNILHMAASSAYAKLKSSPYATDAEDILERALEATSFPAKSPKS